MSISVDTFDGYKCRNPVSAIKPKLEDQDVSNDFQFPLCTSEIKQEEQFLSTDMLESTSGDPLQYDHSVYWLPQEISNFRFSSTIPLSDKGDQDPLKSVEKKQSNDTTLLFHIKDQHWTNGAKEYKCDQCGRTFSVRRTLRRHKKMIHSPRGLRRCTCKMCDKTYATPEVLKRHIRIKHPLQELKSAKYACFYCQKSFLLKYNLKVHIVGKHLSKGDKGFSCDQCNRVYGYETTLKRHLITVHSSQGRKRYICSSCHKNYATPEALKTHLSVKHPFPGQNPARYTCFYCVRSFTMKYNLRVHIISLHLNKGWKGYNCDQCDRAYSHENNLRRHIKTVHSTKVRKRYSCQSCDKTYAAPQALKEHIKIKHFLPEQESVKYTYFHYRKSLSMERDLKSQRNRFISNSGHEPCVTPEASKPHESLVPTSTGKESAEYKCFYCARTFPMKRDLRLHIFDIHTNECEKKFNHNQCGKNYSLKRTHKRHKIMIHSSQGEKGCFCKSCGKTYSTSSNLKKHMKIKHPLPGQE